MPCEDSALGSDHSHIEASDLAFALVPWSLEGTVLQARLLQSPEATPRDIWPGAVGLRALGHEQSQM